MLKKLVVIFLILSATAGLGRHALASVSVEASIEPSSFSMLEGAELLVTVQGGSRDAEILLPEVKNITFHSRGQSSQFNWINGKSSSSVTSSYQVEPSAPGNYTIPPITVTMDGDRYTTRPLQFTVTDTPAPPAGGSSANTDTEKNKANDLAFLRISPTGNRYLGEIVPITLKAYFDQRVRVDLNSLPRLDGDGIVMEPLQGKPQQTEETVGNRRYSVLTWETSLSGIKAGEHNFRLLLDATMLVPVKRRRPSLFNSPGFFNNGFDDPFFDSVFGNYQRRPITVQSPPLTMYINMLPDQGKPADFNGAIGQFQLSVAADPTEVEAGEPITLLMAISGKGNFDRVTAPTLPASDDWKGYSPSDSFEPGTNPASGTKTFEQALVPKKTALTSIPPLSFSYFDPQTRQYRTLSSDPIAITVKSAGTPEISPPPVAKTLTAAPSTTPQTVEPYSDLAAPHLEIGTLSRRITPIFFSSWYLLIVSACCLLLTVLAAVRLHHRRQRANPELREKRARRLKLHEDFSQLEDSLKQNDSHRFLHLCRNILQQQLGQWWRMEPEAISLVDLTQRLPADSPLIAIYRATDEAAYGGTTPSHEIVSRFYHQLRQELEKLQ